MRRKKETGVKSNITSSVKAEEGNKKGRKWRDKKTYVTSPIKGSVTQSKQWSRNEGWTP